VRPFLSEWWQCVTVQVGVSATLVDLYSGFEFRQRFPLMTFCPSSRRFQNSNETTSLPSKFINQLLVASWKTPYFVKIVIIIQGVPRGKDNILGGHSIGHSKQKCICTCVLFRTVSEIKLFYCTVPKLSIRKLRTVSNTGIYCSGDKVGTVYLV
jgi:hypothetical protein